MDNGVALWKWEDWYMIVSRDEEYMIWPPSTLIAMAMSASDIDFVLCDGGKLSLLSM